MKTIIKVALIALLWITLINSGSLPPDTTIRLNMAHALWTGEEEVALAADYRPKSRLDFVGVKGVGDKRYYPYDMGQPLLMVPGDWLGTQLHKILPQFSPILLRRLCVNLLTVIPLNVLVVLSCYWLLRLFNYNEKIAGSASLMWLVTTTVLPYAQVFQQNNPVLLSIILAYGSALAYLKYNQLPFAFLSGLAIGAAILVRTTSVIHGFTVFLFFVGCLIYQDRNFLKLFNPLALWFIGILPLTLLGRFFDYLRFGNFLTTGASLGIKQLNTDPLFSGVADLPPNYPLIHPPYIGIWGVLFSPAKSIFIYDPLLLPCFILGIVFWKRFTPFIQWYLVTAIFNLIFHILLTSRIDFWHGDGAWAARYHVTSVHLLLIPLIALLFEYLLSNKGFKRGLISGLIGLSFLVQFASLIFDPSVNTGRVYFAPPSSFLELRLVSRIKTISCLINPDGWETCPRSLKYDKANLKDRINLLPVRFNKIQKFLWQIWGLLLIVAIVSTLRFWILS